MRIRTPGRICKGLWLLGREESCVYLMESSGDFMFISGGMCYLVPEVLRQMDEFGIQGSRITKMLILHAHFDHVGLVPFLKRTYPHMALYASARAWQLLGDPRVIQTINRLSRDVALRKGMGEVLGRYDLEWRADITGSSVGEGDRIPLGDLWVDIIETPGHSSCSLSGHVPGLKALFASDGAGIPFGRTIIASGNSNFTQYQQSLEKLRHLPVDYVCADHYGYVAGEEAGRFIAETVEAARDRRASVEEIYRQTGDVEATVEQMVSDFFRENPDYLLTPEITRGVYRQMVRHIAEAMEKGQPEPAGKVSGG
jgi:glyoxylase-like metal-dependent hydrolase (beta-lactamase superfamily II)